MSEARCVLPGETYEVVRRCSERRLFLRPNDKVNRILRYCLALAVARVPMHIHAFCFMSNHVHLVVTDPEGRLPKFMELLDMYIARNMNAELERRESFWGPQSYSCIPLRDDQTVLEKIVYTLCNPVAAGLVRFGFQWPGFRSRPRDVMGRRIRAQRTGQYFVRGGAAPAVAEFEMVRPPIFADLGDAELADEIDRAMKERERQLQAEMAHRRRQFAGKGAVLARNPLSRPSTREEREDTRPKFAASTHEERQRAREERRLFLAQYGDALRRYRAGEDDVVFPAGTYSMRLLWKVQVAPS